MQSIDEQATDACPYCGMPIEDPGEGFMTHLDEHPSCKSQWGEWSDNLADDAKAD